MVTSRFFSPNRVISLTGAGHLLMSKARFPAGTAARLEKFFRIEGRVTDQVDKVYFFSEMVFLLSFLGCSGRLSRLAAFARSVTNEMAGSGGARPTGQAGVWKITVQGF